MATGTINISGAICHIPELWATDSRDAVEANVVLAGLVDNDTVSDLKGGPGDTLNIPYISNPTAQTTSASTNLIPEMMGPSDAEASQVFTTTTKQHVVFAIENAVAVQSKINMRAKYAGKAGYVLAAAADTNIASLAASFSNTVGTLGLEPTDDNVLTCAQNLDDANAPSESRFMVLRPASYYALLKSDRFVRTDYIGGGGEKIREAHVGRIYGFDTYKTTLVTAPATGQAENFACHKRGVYFCMQDMKSHSYFSVMQDSDVVSFTDIYGYAEALQPPITAGGGAATDVFNNLLRGTS